MDIKHLVNECAIDHFYMIYDAYNDVAEPISKNDAKRIVEEQRLIPRRLESGKEMGYDIQDAEILLCFRLSDLEKLIKDGH